jgi:hypothetical protein
MHVVLALGMGTTSAGTGLHLTHISDWQVSLTL